MYSMYSTQDAVHVPPRMRAGSEVEDRPAVGSLAYIWSHVTYRWLRKYRVQDRLAHLILRSVEMDAATQEPQYSYTLYEKGHKHVATAR
jgi:hypothetical protein